MRCRLPDVACALALSGAAASLACSKTTTSLTAPTVDKCQVSVSSSPTTFAATGGQGSLTIATARDCTWSIKSEAPWLAIASESAGQGEASIPYSVAANPVPSVRSGSILVGASTVSVSQAAAPCNFSLSRPSDNVAAAGGNLSVGIAVINGCPWSAASTATWISVASGSSGSGAGTVGLAVALNPGAARSGQVRIAGQLYTVAQTAAPASDPAPAPAPAPSPTPAPAPTPAPNPTPSPSPSPTPTPNPTPTPTPNPTPTPPAPPPPAEQRVDFSGEMSSVFGSCPSVGFAVDGMLVVTNSETDYKKGKCDDLRRGRDIRGSGVRQSNGSVRATSIRFEKD